MSQIKKKDSKLQTKKTPISDNESEYSSSYDEGETENESPVRKSRAPSNTKVIKKEQTDSMMDPHDRPRRRRGRRGGATRSRSRSGRSQSRRSGRRSSRSRRRR